MKIIKKILQRKKKPIGTIISPKNKVVNCGKELGEYARKMSARINGTTF